METKISINKKTCFVYLIIFQLRDNLTMYRQGKVKSTFGTTSNSEKNWLE